MTWTSRGSLAVEGGLTAIACPTAGVCVALTGRATSVRLEGNRWSSPLAIEQIGVGAAPLKLVCVSATLCWTFDGRGRVISYDGKNWSQPVEVEPTSSGGIITAISCASPAFCAIVDSNGDASIDAGRGWSRLTPVVDSAGLAAVSCPSVGICFALDAQNNEVYQYANGRWTISASLNLSTPQGGSEPNTFIAIACGTPRFCVALDDFGDAFTYDGRWSSNPHHFDTIQLGNASLSCSAASRCVVVDDSNHVVIEDHGAWSAPTPLDSSAGTLVGVSCAPHGRCVAVDDRGGYLIGTAVGAS